jgi:hypothetical protein
MNVGEMREALLNRDRISVAMYAMQTGQSPAALYYKLAKDRGYHSSAPIGRNAMRGLTLLAQRDGEAFDKMWDKLAARGRLG